MNIVMYISSVSLLHCVSKRVHTDNNTWDKYCMYEGAGVCTSDHDAVV